VIKQSVTAGSQRRIAYEPYGQSLIDTRRADAELAGGVVLACHDDSIWCDESHRQMYYRIIQELGYDPDDVYELRVTEASIEVDFVDFDHPDWPLLTRRHAAPPSQPL